MSQNKEQPKAEVTGVEVVLPSGHKETVDLEEARTLWFSLGLLFDKQKEYITIPAPFQPQPIQPMNPVNPMDPPWGPTYPWITFSGPTANTDQIMCVDLHHE
jgi:hypothetical protein